MFVVAEVRIFLKALYTRCLFYVSLKKYFTFNFCRRGKNVVDEMIGPWYETRLPTILSDYALADIYNAYEFGLFFQALPEKSKHLKSEKCVGG